jgi:hypothetical protein
MARVIASSEPPDKSRLFRQDPRSTTGTGMVPKVLQLCACYFFREGLDNLAIMSSAVSSPLFTFSTAVRNAKPSLGSESISRLRSAIGPRLSYFSRSSTGTFRAAASFPKISSEGNRLPSSMSERKGEEMPLLFANSRKDRSALSRNSRSRWPKEVSIMCKLRKLTAV